MIYPEDVTSTIMVYDFSSNAKWCPGVCALDATDLIYCHISTPTSSKTLWEQDLDTFKSYGTANLGQHLEGVFYYSRSLCYTIT